MNTVSAPATKQDLNDLFDRIAGTFATKDDLKVMATKDDLHEALKGYATKDDVERIVGDTVGEIVGDALQMISERFDKQDGYIRDLQTITIRIDNKLNDLSETVGDHAAKIRLLQRKIA